MPTAERIGFSEIREHTQLLLAGVLTELQGSPPVDPTSFPSLDVFNRFMTSQLREIGQLPGGRRRFTLRHWDGQKDSHICLINHIPIDGKGLPTEQPTDRYVNRMLVCWYSPGSEFDLALQIIQGEQPNSRLLLAVAIKNPQKSVTITCGPLS